MPVLEAWIQGCGETSAKALRWKHNGIFEEQKGGSVTGGGCWAGECWGMRSEKQSEQWLWGVLCSFDISSETWTCWSILGRMVWSDFIKYWDTIHLLFSSVQSLSLVWLFVTPWTARSTPGLPVHHQLPESTQTHVYRVGDAIQPSHLLLSPSPPAVNLSQHQGLFKIVSSSHQVAKVLEFQLQHQSFQWTPRTDL